MCKYNLVVAPQACSESFFHRRSNICVKGEHKLVVKVFFGLERTAIVIETRRGVHELALLQQLQFLAKEVV